MSAAALRLAPLHVFVLGVSVAGAVVAALLVAGGAGDIEPDLKLALLAAFVVAGELVPIRFPRRDGSITTSTTFAFAVLLTHGPAAAVLVLALASLAADLLHRRSALSVGFNAAQYALAIAAGAWVLDLAGEPVPLAATVSLADLPALAAAGAVFFVLNNALTAIASALLGRVRVVPYLLHDLSFQAGTAAMLLGLAPIVVVVVDASAALVPLLALPLVAIHTAASQATRNQHQALHDSLTGLPNRVLFQERLQAAIDRARHENRRAAVLIMDLDRFKEVNDTLGHHHGDLLLRAVGARVRSALRDGDTIARLGGDEFGIVLPDLDGPADACRTAERISAALEAPLMLGSVPLAIRGTTGIACFPDHGDSVDLLFQRSDIAMYAAKGHHLRHATYEPSQDSTSLERLELVAELRRGLDRGELVVHYQPKLDLRTGRVDSVEALVRWAHPKRGLIPPGVFIPLAEQTGLISPVTQFVVETALREVMGWRSRGIHVAVAVNLSTRVLVDEKLPDRMRQAVHDAGADTSTLELEITESSVMDDPERALRALERLGDMGFRLSIDDFGTGHSSLAYLKSLPVQELKIDRAFIHGMDESGSDHAIVRAAIELGRALGLEVVAEGVERELQLDALSELGCDFAQGYHLSRPLPAREFEAWMAADSAARAAARPVQTGAARLAAGAA